MIQEKKNSSFWGVKDTKNNASNDECMQRDFFPTFFLLFCLVKINFFFCCWFGVCGVKGETKRPGHGTKEDLKIFRGKII